MVDEATIAVWYITTTRWYITTSKMVQMKPTISCVWCSTVGECSCTVCDTGHQKYLLLYCAATAFTSNSVGYFKNLTQDMKGCLSISQ